MAAHIDQDLTKGPIPKHFWALAIPAAVGMLFNTLYNVVDVYFAGLVSTAAQAGLSLGFQILFVSMALGVGLGAAMGALVGNALGEGDKRLARRYCAQGISYGLLGAVILAVAGQAYGPGLIRFVSAEAEYQNTAITYYRLLTLALPGFILAAGCNGILQAHGDGKSMRRALMVAFFVNIGLNPLLMFGIPGVWGGLGFPGLAVSTIISQTGVMAYLIRQVIRLDTMEATEPRHFAPDWPRYKEITEQVVPSGFAFLIMILAGVVVQFALKDFGEHAVAGFGIGIRLEQLVILPLIGMSSALLPIAAQNLGAGNPDRVREAIFYCWKAGAVIALIAGPILFLGAPYFVRLFTNDADVILVGRDYLRVGAFMLYVYLIHFSITSFLQAAKRPIWSLWISLYRQAFGVAFFVWLYVGVFGMPVIGVWFGTSTAAATGAVMALLVARHIAREKIGGLRGEA
ncbi:MATE family efflux transporter [Jannaschia sp. CCS1]|uniref:MATE family efflux transporter n=1 Tax=Jannaschia sp. (strain CCS1) TaxID=290400 RepID=UPI000053CBC3|nr:MATE family efflux transporter [Jannaschia sp. CCS1]ABD56880.1 MATE efflux family protein [Jannaschia sp. CCS1]